ncbi:MAG: 30S ribosome-binding factor RbfA [Rhodospirillales bacterium]
MQQRNAKAPSQRQLRVGEEIRHVLADIFERGEVRDPGLQGVSVTVTEVRVSPDLKKATAFVMPLGGNAAQARDVVEVLTRAQPFLRHRLAKAVRLRHVPDLDFSVDTSFDQAGRIERLLREAGVSGGGPGNDPGNDPGNGPGDDHGA